MCVYSLLLALTWHRLVLAPQAPRLARAWPPVLSPSARVSDKTRDGGVAERLKAHAWKVCMRETVSRVRIPPPPPPSKDLILHNNMPGRGENSGLLSGPYGP